MRALLASALVLVSFTPLTAQSTRPRFSAGYAYAKYLEEGGGSAPVGGYISVATAGRPVSSSISPTTAMPRLHLLFALRHDSIEGVSNTSYGAMTGLGVDVPAGNTLFLRVGGDFQLFVDNGETLKTMRLLAGVAF